MKHIKGDYSDNLKKAISNSYVPSRDRLISAVTRARSEGLKDSQIAETIECDGMDSFLSGYAPLRKKY